MPVVLQNIIRFVTLVLVQVLVLNNMQFLGYVNPYIYILFIFALPVKLSRWVTLLLAFALGILIDAFSNTWGIHAAACVLIAFLRQPLIKSLVDIEEGINPTPTLVTFGILPYVKYVIFLVLIHHSTLFLLEAFSFSHIGWLVLKILLSSLVTMGVILLLQLLKQK